MVVQDRVVAQPEAEAVHAFHERAAQRRVLLLLSQPRQLRAQLQRHMRRMPRLPLLARAMRNTGGDTVLRPRSRALTRTAPALERQHRLLRLPSRSLLRAASHVERALILSE